MEGLDKEEDAPTLLTFIVMNGNGHFRRGLERVRKTVIIALRVFSLKNGDYPSVECCYDSA